MAWERLVQAGYVIGVPGLGESSPGAQHFIPLRGYITSLAGAHYLQELTMSRFRLFWERNWFPVVIAVATVLSNVIALWALSKG